MSKINQGKFFSRNGDMNSKSRLFMLAMVALGGVLGSTASYGDFFVSSFGTNELMRFDEDSGAYLGVIGMVDGPFASQIGFDGDLFVSSHNTGEVLRYDSQTGEFKGAFIKAHEGGLTKPTAPNFGPDGKVYVGDLATNTVLRYDRNGKFIDVFADGVSSPLNGPFMQTFDEGTMYIASGYTNSILRYDLKTKEFMGHFVAPGSGGLVVPVGLEFGPDGNLYTSSSATSEVLRYDGKTGEFIDKFVPAGAGGMSSPRAIRFGGANTDLYVISSDTNTIIQFDRVTGEFVDVIATSEGNGMLAARGLTFTPRPEFFVDARVVRSNRKHEHDDDHQHEGDGHSAYKAIKVDYRLKDYTDRHPVVKLVSIQSSDPEVNISEAVKNARFGEEDYNFRLDFTNSTGVEQQYTIKYTATNDLGETTIATTMVQVPAE